ncbi:syntaxin binding protein [Babesia ovis]|uniref:Syntaxin binding protein n=1 Tax=Babesia ovis TaxID=5869 RepID=A0A9W5TDJ9_BABOV|nr:syntaxin binding protein [Babesia ovis]
MSLKEKAKERLIWAIRQVVLPFGRVVLLVDNRSLRIVSACCSITDLVDEGVDLVEIVTKKRQPMKSKVAIYLLNDDYTGLDEFIKDFTPGKELYKSAFIMFNGHLSDDRALRKIAEHVNIQKVLGCFELHLNFVPYEARVFHGNMGFTLLSLYPNHSGNIVHNIASRLASLCSVLGTFPQIRYQACPNGLPQLVATGVHALIRDTSVEATRQTGDLLLVVDRSLDAIAMHIHEYTYQAFVYDVMRIPCCSDPIEQRSDDVWEFEYLANSGKREQRSALLSCEKDVLWERFRHQHIQKVNELVSEEVEQFAGQSATSVLNKANNTKDILNAVRELPKTQYMVEKYWAHIALTERSFEHLDSMNLVKIGEIEQAIATNMDKNGNKLSHSKLLQQLTELLGDVEINDDTKVRLILLYVGAYRNVSSGHLDELIDAAGLPPSCGTVVRRFVELGLGPASMENLPPVSPRNGGSTSKVIHKHHEKGDAHAYYKKHATGNEYQLSRYMPEIRHIVGRSIAGTLDAHKFPTVGAENEKAPSQGRRSASGNRRIIIYVLGGVTFSEMRVTYDMAEKTGTDLYIGGDSIIVPSDLLENMKHAFSVVEKK